MTEDIPTVSAEDLPKDVHNIVSNLIQTHLLQFEAFPKGATSGAPVSEVVGLLLRPQTSGIELVV